MTCKEEHLSRTLGSERSEKPGYNYILTLDTWRKSIEETNLQKWNSEGLSTI